MGEIADDMVNGVCCDQCSCYFQGDKEDEVHVHGYPVTCWDCWKTLSKAERKQHQRAERQTLR